MQECRDADRNAGHSLYAQMLNRKLRGCRQRTDCAGQGFEDSALQPRAPQREATRLQQLHRVAGVCVHLGALRLDETHARHPQHRPAVKLAHNLAGGDGHNNAACGGRESDRAGDVHTRFLAYRF